MYKTYFGFHTRPFEKDIASDQLLHHSQFIEFKKRMEFLLTHRGIGVIWGPPGSGKTAGLRWFRDSLSKNRYRFYYLPEVPASISEYYRQLALCMELKPAFRRVDMYKQIQGHIRELALDKKITPVICLDECHAYPHTVLEALRIFLNFDMDSRHLMILILAGQPELRQRLKFAVYEPLLQRVTVHFQFDGLPPLDTEQYLLHRMDIAGVKSSLFEPAAIQFICQVTKGIMRKVDTLALRSLSLAAELKKKTIDQELVNTVMQDILWA